MAKYYSKRDGHLDSFIRKLKLYTPQGATSLFPTDLWRKGQGVRRIVACPVTLKGTTLKVLAVSHTWKQVTGQNGHGHYKRWNILGYLIPKQKSFLSCTLVLSWSLFWHSRVLVLLAHCAPLYSPKAMWTP